MFLDRDRDLISVGSASYRPYYGWAELPGGDTAAAVIESEKEYLLRCFCRDEHFEFYLDDRWMAALALDQAPSAGALELFVERGSASFSDIRIAALEPFPG
jgi:hypothetical protein